MTKTLDTVLLLALPASGKSEVRRFLANQSETVCAEHFHMGPTVQLDDYPYVHFMRTIDDVLSEAGKNRIFFEAADRGFHTPLDWGTLIELVNEDYADLSKLKIRNEEKPVETLLRRMDAARKKVGAPGFLGDLDPTTIALLDDKLTKEVTEFVREWNQALPDTLEGKTIVIEFARGGAHGSSMPLPNGFGYNYSLKVLSKEILSRSVILYVWVTPEQSRQKNDERARPGADGSILFHGVPMHVMLNDYGCDDLAYLLEQSDKPATIKVEKGGQTFYLPTGRCDNREDLTTFVREDMETWSDDDSAKLRDALSAALEDIWKNYAK